jgi:Bacterial Ig-like domain (group 2)
VTGRFADGIDRDVTSASAGTTYMSAAPAIATVDVNGRVTAHAAGHTVIQAKNGDDVAAFDVVVADAPGDSDGDGTVGLADFLALRSCWTGPGDDPAFIGASNRCRDAFDADADADADVDRPDYDAFLARYTGPAADCNANGTPDLTDIVDGASQDANGDGVPDECGATTPAP